MNKYNNRAPAEDEKSPFCCVHIRATRDTCSTRDFLFVRRLLFSFEGFFDEQAGW